MKISNCKVCNKESITKYYKAKIYCSRACRDIDPDFKKAVATAQKQTFDKKYNGHPMLTTAVKNKQQDTMLTKYGSKHALMLEEFKKKSETTKTNLYGNAHFNNVKKVKNTKLIRYGSATYNGNKKRISTALNKKILEWNDIRIIKYDSNVPIKDQSFKIQCIKCNRVWDCNLNNNYYPSCKVCSTNNSITKISKGHQELIDYLNLLLPPNSFVVNNRFQLNGDELDIYIPNNKLAIEFNGVFFHSSLFKDSTYHLKKTSKCLARGITLLHIFDYEWWLKKDLIKSMIAAKLGIFENRLYARNCDIRPVKPSDKKLFLSQNHLQGTANSSLNLGLYYENGLVSILTLSKPRFDTKADWEIIRFATLKGLQIVGGFSKLFTHFIRNYNPSLIITYADRKWGSGELYYSNSFSFHAMTPPNYSYFKNMTMYPRQVFQKHKLPKLLKNYDKGQTEFQNMENNGYLKFWDCGNVKLYYNTANLTKQKSH